MNIQSLHQPPSSYCPEIILPLPLYACAVSAGFPSPASDYIEKNIDLNEELIRKRLSKSVGVI